MLKKILGMAMAVTLGATLTISGDACAKGFTHLSFVGGYAHKHPCKTKVWNNFIAEATKTFPGANGLSFDYFATNELFPELEAMAAISAGSADFARTAPSLFPGKQNLLAVTDIPSLCGNAIVGSLVTHELIEKFPALRAELPENSVPFTSWASAAYQIHLRDAVKGLDDVKGRKIIVWGSTTLEMVKLMGGNPIRLAPPDTYLALSKGMADGVICPIAPVRSFKISDVAKYHLMINSGVCGFTISANKDLWNSFPADMKKWLTDNGGLKMALDLGKALEDGCVADIKWMKGLGHEFVTLNEADTAKLAKLLEPLVDDWSKNLCKDKDPALVQDILKYARERVDFHTKKLQAGEYGNYSL